MKKNYWKLISVILALLVSVTVLFSSTYAWMVLSSSPAVNGIQVAIGGGNTILIAPNMKETDQDGTVYNYPGRFASTMNFGQHSAYDYLKEIGKLNPVSTVNGIDWVLPVYYSGSDEEVQEGLVPSGTLKDVSTFYVDSELEHANLPADREEEIYEGHYVYLDFWVVSPGNDYKLRVSTGLNEEDSGSFVIDLLEAEETESGFTLTETEGGISSAVRVGFLANDIQVTDDSMQKYAGSAVYDERFTRLKGFYLEPDTGTSYLPQDRFTIYEPNGDYHPADADLDGKYVETKPLALVDGQVIEVSAEEHLTVQKKSTWLPSKNNPEHRFIEEIFQVALYASSQEGKTAGEVTDQFYNKYLQGQISSYVKKGGFVQRTNNLYSQLATDGGKVILDDLQDQDHGATKDVYIIELERNVPQRIRMFIWLEGQDVDCINSISASRFAVNIELASGDE